MKRHFNLILFATTFSVIVSCNEQHDTSGYREPSDPPTTNSTPKTYQPTSPSNDQVIQPTYPTATPQNSFQPASQDDDPIMPVSFTFISFNNQSRYGTIISEGKAFKKEDVKFIGWKFKYRDPYTAEGKTQSARLYVKFMKLIPGDNGWYNTYEYKGKFKMRNGDDESYSQFIDVTDNKLETAEVEGNLGNDDGTFFKPGFYTVEFYWDYYSKGRAIFIKHESFEIY